MSASASEFAPAQRLPAWKRLGLKVRGAASDDSPTTPTSNGTVNGDFTSAKRKQPHSSILIKDDQSANKKARIDAPTTQKLKSVSFDTDAKTTDGPAVEAKTQKQKQKKSKSKKSKTKLGVDLDPKAKPVSKIEDTLAYLRLWKHDRTAWKYNKNHQTLLIKYIFSSDPDASSPEDRLYIPSKDIDAFYDYIHALKGFSRTRLRESVLEGKGIDISKGKQLFPKEGDVEKMQAEYEQIVQTFSADGSESVNGNGKRLRRINEIEYAQRSADSDVQLRLIKRIRAENILRELSESETSSSSASSALEGETSIQNMEGEASGDQVAPDAASMQEEGVNGEAQPAAGGKRKRKRKLRNAATSDSEESSSSEDESDSDDADDEEAESSSAEESEEDSTEDEASTSEESSSSEEEGGAPVPEVHDVEMTLRDQETSPSSTSSEEYESESGSEEEDSDGEEEEEGPS
jgi:hypothetical protein